MIRILVRVTEMETTRHRIWVLEIPLLGAPSVTAIRSAKEPGIMSTGKLRSTLNLIPYPENLRIQRVPLPKIDLSRIKMVSMPLETILRNSTRSIKNKILKNFKKLDLKSAVRTRWLLHTSRKYPKKKKT